MMLTRAAIWTTRLFAKSRLRVSVIFLVSALSAALLVSACDNGTTPGNPTTAPTVPGATAAPIGGTPAERGKVVFARYCNTCHPGGGRGAGPSILREATGAPDEELTAVVRNGKNRMPPFGASTISDSDLTDLIAYMRTIQAQQ